MVKWLGFWTFIATAQVQSLVQELRSHKPCSAGKKKKKAKPNTRILKNESKWTVKSSRLRYKYIFSFLFQLFSLEALCYLLCHFELFSSFWISVSVSQCLFSTNNSWTLHQKKIINNISTSELHQVANWKLLQT